MLVFFPGEKTGGCVNKYRFLALLLSCVLAANVSAFDRIKAAMNSRTSIKAFSDAEGTQELTPLVVKDIHFPLDVYEVSDKDLVRVKISGQQVWLDRKQVIIELDAVEANCLTVNLATAKSVPGGSRGANAGCK